MLPLRSTAALEARIAAMFRSISLVGSKVTAMDVVLGLKHIVSSLD